jgi:dihydrodipicolinate synthase/N-acetylneuraminate lyase
MADNNEAQVNELKNKGNACFQSGKYEEAITHFTAAIQLDPNNHILYSNRSGSYALLKNYLKALEDADHTVRLSPNWAKGYSRQGTALYYMERYREALEAFNKGLKFEPENVQLAQGLQQVQLALKSAPIKKGVWGQMLTPYNSTQPYPIVWNMVDEMVDWYINKGCAGIFAVSPTSEMSHLTEDERLQLSTAVVKRVNNHLPVIACAGFGASVEEKAEGIKKMHATGVSAVILPVNQIISPSESDEAFKTKLESLLNLTGDIPLGILETPGKSLGAATLSWISSTTKFVLYIDNSTSITKIKEKIEKVNANPGLKYWITSPTLLMEALRLGVNGFTSNATCFYPQLFVWLFENYHRADRENPEMIQRFLSVSQLAVDKGFPLSAKLYLHFGELTRMDGVARVPQQPGFEINEEDMLRVNHLRDLVHFISLSLDEEKSSKVTSKKKDNSTLL